MNTRKEEPPHDEDDEFAKDFLRYEHTFKPKDVQLGPKDPKEINNPAASRRGILM